MQSNTTQYCLICNNIIESFDIKIDICGESNCEFLSRTLFTKDNFVYNFIINKQNEALFILSLAKKAINNDKYILNPMPLYNGILKYRTDQDTLADLRKIINDSNIEKDINNILEMKLDSIIYDNFGPIKYGLFKFMLKSNLIDIQKNEMFLIKHMRTYEIIHTQSKLKSFEKEVSSKGSIFLYHGSDMINWYSIMMNGLQVYSNTERMTSGAAYGEGIYLSNSLMVSTQYSLKNNLNANNGFIIGVFEVIGKLEDYKKTSNIYVVKDINLLKLKYILWNSTNSFKQTEVDAINQKFNRNIIEEKKVEKTFYSSFRNKRLLKEIQYVTSGKTEDYGLRFEVNEENMLQWKLFISKIDKDSELWHDMQKMNIEHIEMEILFEQQYPIKQPFVRIVSPVFKYKTGNITIGGSICTELLTSQGWSPANSIESLIIQIKANILETGRLDLAKKGYKYTIEEAKSSFQRMLISHNWK